MSVARPHLGYLDFCIYDKSTLQRIADAVMRDQNELRNANLFKLTNPKCREPTNTLDNNLNYALLIHMVHENYIEIFSQIKYTESANSFRCIHMML